MAHPLDGAYAHIRRADRDFQELKSIIEGFIRSYENKMFRYYDPAPLKIRDGMTIDSTAGEALNFPLIEASVCVSAIIHHLRAALDYLIYELACEDSPGVSHDGTQFIIEDVKSDPKDPQRGFDPRSKRFLRGLGRDHILMIEEFQPYKGIDWTEILRNISNPDKHRKLTAIKGRWQGSRKLVGGRAKDLESGPGKILRGIGESGADVYMETEESINVYFPDWGLLVVETLEYLKLKVSETVDSFNPEFK